MITGRGELFYSQCGGPANAPLLSPAAGGGGLRERAASRAAGNIAASCYSAYTGTYTAAIRGRAMTAAGSGIILAAVMMALGIGLVSILVIRLVPLRVTAPIGQLITRIGQTNLDNPDLSPDHGPDNGPDHGRSLTRPMMNLSNPVTVSMIG